MIFKLAWRNLWRQKRRTLLTASALALALFLSLLTRSIQEGTYAHNIDNAARFSTGLIQLQNPKFHNSRSIDDLLPGDAAFIEPTKTIENINHQLPRIESFALAAGDNNSKATLVMAGIPEKEQAYSGMEKYLSAGEFIHNDDKQVLVGEGLAQYLGLKVGDSLVLYSQGYHGQTAAGLYPIKGLLHFPTPGLDDQLIYLPLPLAQTFYSTGNQVTHWVLHIDELSLLEHSVKTLQQRYTEVAVKDWQTLSPEMAQQITLDKVGGQFMMYLLYGIVGFGLFATLMMMALERQREFGVMLATGMLRRKIQLLLTIESSFIALLGCVIGLALALPTIGLLSLYPIRLTGETANMLLEMGWEPIIPVMLTPVMLIKQIAIILILLVICLSYPLWRVQKLVLIDALKGGHHAH